MFEVLFEQLSGTLSRQRSGVGPEQQFRACSEQLFQDTPESTPGTVSG